MVVLKEQKYHLYLSKDEYSEVLQSLIRLKNSLIAQGRYTDAVDDILCKVLSAKKRKFKIKYIWTRIKTAYTFVSSSNLEVIDKLKFLARYYIIFYLYFKFKYI